MDGPNSWSASCVRCTKELIVFTDRSSHSCLGCLCLGKHIGKKYQTFCSIRLKKLSSWRASACVKPCKKQLSTPTEHSRSVGRAATPASVNSSFTHRRSSGH